MIGTYRSAESLKAHLYNHNKIFAAPQRYVFKKEHKLMRMIFLTYFFTGMQDKIVTHGHTDQIINST